MIPHVEIGTGYKGCLDYIYDTGHKHLKDVEYICGTAIGTNADELLSEFVQSYRLRPTLNKCVAHISLSAAPGNGRLDRNKWTVIAEQFLAELGFDLSQTIYTVVRHGETDHDHIHIALSRVMLDGSAWDDGRCNMWAIRACRNLEKLHNLTRVESVKPEIKRGLDKTEKSKAQNARKAGKPQPPNKLTLQGWIDEILSQNKKISAPAFVIKLAAKGVLIRPNLANAGRLNGFSFVLDGIAYKGSDLGRAYTLNSLMDRGLTYDPSKDADALRALSISSDHTSPFISMLNTRQTSSTFDQEGLGLSSRKQAIDETLRLTIDHQLRLGPQSTIKFVEGLAASGVQVTVALANNGRLSGFRFFLGDGESLKGSELGPDYTLAGLLRRSLTYDSVQAAKLKATIKALGSKSIDSQRYSEIDLKWPDTIIPVYQVNQKTSNEAFRNFIKSEGLLYWKDQDASDMIFYHRARGPKGERQGIAYVDKGNKIEVRISTEDNILKALKYGVLKWGIVRITGAPDFVSRAEALARANGIPLGQDLAAQVTETLRKPKQEERHAPPLVAERAAPLPSSTPVSTRDGRTVLIPPPKDWQDALLNVYYKKMPQIQAHLEAHIALLNPIITKRLQYYYNQYVELQSRTKPDEDGLDETIDSTKHEINLAVTAHKIFEAMCKRKSLAPSEESKNRMPLIKEIESNICGSAAMEEATEHMSSQSSCSFKM